MRPRRTPLGKRVLAGLCKLAAEVAPRTPSGAHIIDRNMNGPFRALAIGAIAVAVALVCPEAWAQTPNSATDRAVASAADQANGQLAGPLADPQADQATDQPAAPPDDQSAHHRAVKRLWDDVQGYYTAPLRWDGEQWALFGGTLGGIALAHHFDSNVRTHFAPGPATGASTSDLEDAAPALGLFVGTYIYASQWHDESGFTAVWAMAEAGGLSTVTTYALKYAFRRSGPNETTDPNQWFASGTSFPSEHVAAAFAVGTVFAESGSGGFRWVTRVLGYGVASFTAYQRLKHNAHWLSDVVAGAALGGSTGIFVLDRTYGGRGFASAFSVVPMDGGLMLAYHTSLP